MVIFVSSISMTEAIKVNFMIIGAQKSGTSGLFSTLRAHPNIYAPARKELYFFSHWYAENKIPRYHKNFAKFRLDRPDSITFEATPLYLFHPAVPKRLKAYNPNLKLIVLLREPATRALSAWKMYHYAFEGGKHSEHHDPRPFQEAVENNIQNFEKESYWDNEIAYVKRGLYFRQLNRYLRFFPMSQIMILEHQTLLNWSAETSRAVQSFLEVPYHDLTREIRNKSVDVDDTLYAPTLSKLKTFYQPYNKRLFRLIGQNYDWD